MYNEAFYVVGATVIPILLLGSTFSVLSNHTPARSRADRIHLRIIFWMYRIAASAGAVSILFCLVMTSGRVDLSQTTIIVLDQTIMLSVTFLVSLSLAAAMRPIDRALRRLKQEADDEHDGSEGNGPIGSQPTIRPKSAKKGLLALRRDQ